MSRDRGLRLQNALARYLRTWWPHADSAGAGRKGSDVLGTPSVVWENKTADKFEPLAFARQAAGHAGGCKPGCPASPPPFGDCECIAGVVPVVVYWPRGVGEANAGNTLAIVPLKVMVRLLKEAGY